MSYKENAYDKRARKFITLIRVLTDEFLSGKKIFMPLREQEIRNLFDSFAKIYEFSSSLIINCYHELKISLMKIERFAEKATKKTLSFKDFLSEMYEIMEDLYHYEYFGFFSTIIYKDGDPLLPCNINCGCAPFWTVEPFLTDEGKVAYEKVIRFKDPESRKFLCITISKTPRLLEDRKKCSLTDEQLEALKQFVINNREIIILHACDYLVLDSCQLNHALRIRNKNYGFTSKYRIAYTLKNNLNSEENTSGIHYVDLDDMSYDEAVKVYKEIQEEMEANAGKDEEYDIYKPYALASLEILRPE